MPFQTPESWPSGQSTAPSCQPLVGICWALNTPWRFKKNVSVSVQLFGFEFHFGNDGRFVLESNRVRRKFFPLQQNQHRNRTAEIRKNKGRRARERTVEFVTRLFTNAGALCIIPHSVNIFYTVGCHDCLCPTNF
jgi:hypothetical protein